VQLRVDSQSDRDSMWQSEESEDPRTSFADSQPSATQAERIRQYDGVQQSRYGAGIADYGQQQTRRASNSGSGFGRGQGKGTAEDYGKRSGRGQEIYGLPQRQEFPQDIPERADDSSFPLPDNRQSTQYYTAGYTETNSGAQSGYPGLSDYDTQPNQATNSPGYGNQPSAESVPSYTASRSYYSPPWNPLSGPDSLASAFRTTTISGSVPGSAPSPLERGSTTNGSKNTRHVHAVSGVSTEKLEPSESMEYSDLHHPTNLIGYKVIRHGKKFFTVGRIFAMLWTEPTGDKTDGDPTFVSTVVFGERVYSKIRRFVVIKEGTRDCQCLPLSTFGGLGTKKPGLKQSDYAAIYEAGREGGRRRGRRAPSFPEEPGLKKALAIFLEAKETIHQMSRINFKKVYTIEHNVKAKKIGRIVDDDLDRFKHYFRQSYLNDEVSETSAGREPESSSARESTNFYGVGSAYSSMPAFAESGRSNDQTSYRPAGRSESEAASQYSPQNGYTSGYVNQAYPASSDWQSPLGPNVSMDSKVMEQSRQDRPYSGFPTLWSNWEDDMRDGEVRYRQIDSTGDESKFAPNLEDIDSY
jgi:hypothetical protein